MRAMSRASLRGRPAVIGVLSGSRVRSGRRRYAVLCIPHEYHNIFCGSLSILPRRMSPCKVLYQSLPRLGNRCTGQPDSRKADIVGSFPRQSLCQCHRRCSATLQLSLRAQRASRLVCAAQAVTCSNWTRPATCTLSQHPLRPAAGRDPGAHCTTLITKNIVVGCVFQPYAVIRGIEHHDFPGSQPWRVRHLSGVCEETVSRGIRGWVAGVPLANNKTLGAFVTDSAWHAFAPRDNAGGLAVLV